MKKLNYCFALALLSAIIMSCNSGSKKQVEDTEKIDSLVTRSCYVAVYEKDTASLQLNLLQSGKVEGNLLILFPIMPKNEGTIEGKFSGDTLFVDYTFKVGDKKENEYKNPMAFLKKGDQLIMGVGVIETAYGKSYFAKDKPINFERGKFKFNLIDCKK